MRGGEDREAARHHLAAAEYHQQAGHRSEPAADRCDRLDPPVPEAQRKPHPRSGQRPDHQQRGIEIAGAEIDPRAASFAAFFAIFWLLGAALYRGAAVGEREATR